MQRDRDFVLNHDVEDVYETVTEDEYKRRIEARTADDDFVVDDGFGDYDGYEVSFFV